MKKLSEKRVLVAMSGGVDSSVAAARLVEEGYEVTGVSMRLCNEPDACGEILPACCSSDDFLDAFRVAEKLGFHFFVKDLRREFTMKVIEPFVKEYLSGRTPNPCIACNNWLKFHFLFSVADQIGAKYIATGHYGRIQLDEKGVFHLLKGKDTKKDQSYFLFGLTQGQLKRVLFPLGEMTKEEVREVARQLELPTAEKRESQEICFVHEKRAGDFVRNFAGMEEAGGEILDKRGKVVGRHKGIMYYTVGQRSGLGISHPTPLYVVKIDAKGNKVIVGENSDLQAQVVSASGVNYPSSIKPRVGDRVNARIRYRHEAKPAIVTAVGEDTITVRFERSVRAATPGQALVLYDGEECLGGGWIEA
ncbi:MAG: tRNA 2-thiouridine(34) synthase MnmA [Myxococcota bacterium]